MTALRKWSLLFVILFPSLAIPAFSVENAGISANSEPTYQALRHAKVSSEGFQVTNLVLKRDVGTFTLTGGTLCLLEPINGIVTGAVFKGSGTFEMNVKDPVEHRQLRLLTGGEAMKEEFETLTLRFSDATAEEIRKSSDVKPGGTCTPDPLDDMNRQFRNELHYNLVGRLLQPVLAGAPDGFFMAAIRGHKFSDRMYFVIDPMGVPDDLKNLAPEEVALFTTQDNKWGVWYSSHLQSEAAAKLPTNHENGFIAPVQFKIETTIARNASLDGTTTATIISRVDDLRVLPLDLYPTLRVQKVTDENGAPLHWIQEDKNDDNTFYVILPKPLARGARYTFTTSYSGKDAIRKEGEGNYYPVARTDWYPAVRFGSYAMYELMLRVPKGNTMAATGTLISTKTEGGQTTTVWKSEVPQAVAGFNFGEFREEQAKLDKLGIEVKAYANTELPADWKSAVQMALNRRHLEGMQRAQSVLGEASSPTILALDSLSTAPYAKKALSEAQLATMLYTDYFGPISYKHLLVTQQAAANYGQAWPGLIFMPMLYFMDSTQRNGLGWNEADPYFRVVEAHEVAHEWWGHRVGWNSYRDQWMSEGFAHLSASLYLQLVRNERKQYLDFWRDERQLLLDKNNMGVRAIDAGPLILGQRVNNSRNGGVYNRLIYAKGGYVLHMLRMLMANSDPSDGRFKAMMQDFAKTYANGPASTEDFKHITEKYMTPQMDVDRNHTMDWFFEDWVYGTEFPDYSLDAKFDKDGDNIIMDMKVTQSNVSDKFRNAVPLYLELNDGKTIRLGVLTLRGKQTISQKVNLGPAKGPAPTRALLNVNYDTLCTISGN
ncbi:MAG TPA: M1 family aminopeptidase [candidate division Zixibacteria bacterium]|nr:M1 family aminopeptidase [candidate division Zixibacteria bacterium]